MSNDDLIVSMHKRFLSLDETTYKMADKTGTTIKIMLDNNMRQCH